jgi:hypothetical protein
MPDNAVYYQIAYAAAAVIYLAYAFLLRGRARRLDEVERELEQR